MNYFDQIIMSSSDNIESLLSIKKYSKMDSKALFKRNVEIVNLELSYKCNRKCDYCPVRDSSRQNVQDYMPVQLIKKIVNELSLIRFEGRLCLNLYNEPLLDDKLEEKISIIKNRLPFAHVLLNSNGDKLNRSRLKSLSDSGLDSICVTLHPLPGKTDSEEVLTRRILKFIERNSESKKEAFRLLDGQVKFRTGGVLVTCQWPDWRKNGTNRAGLLTDHESINNIRITPCAKPFREFTVFYDGSVQSCCESFHDDTINLAEHGNINHDDIFEVYTLPSMVLLRRHLFSFGPKEGICKSCTAPDFSDSDKDNELRERILLNCTKVKL